MQETKPAQKKPELDYRIRHKKIWKGKVAPIGHKYIIVDLYKGEGKNKRYYYNSMLVEGDYTPEEEAEISDLLREGLRTKFKV